MDHHKHCDHLIGLEDNMVYHGRFGYRPSEELPYKSFHECCVCGRRYYKVREGFPNSHLIFSKEFTESTNPNTGGRIWSRKLKPI